MTQPHLNWQNYISLEKSNDSVEGWPQLVHDGVRFDRNSIAVVLWNHQLVPRGVGQGHCQQRHLGVKEGTSAMTLIMFTPTNMHSTMNSVLAPHPVALGSILGSALSFFSMILPRD